jgi:hypothetical protein
MNSCRWLVWTVLVLAAAPVAAYDQKPLPSTPPEECPGWQESQRVVIGAIPYPGEDRSRVLFDSKELHRMGIVPVVVAVRNGNDFPVVISDLGFSVMDREGKPFRAVGWDVVAMMIMQPDGQVGRAPSTGIPPVDIIRMAGTGGKAKLVQDLKNKAFAVQTIAPGKTFHGVAFFRLGTGTAILEGANLYIAEIYNADTREELVYFEFPLVVPPPLSKK